MDKQALRIDGIPAVLWGSSTNRWIIGVHGDQSHKEDPIFTILAEEANQKGYQVLTFDLSEHGERKTEPRENTPANCVADIRRVLTYAGAQSAEQHLFACSLGAYFGMLGRVSKRIKGKEGRIKMQR